MLGSSIITGSSVLLTAVPWASANANVWTPVRISTAWIKTANLAGFERLRRIIVNATWIAVHNLIWQLFVDDDYTAPVQSGFFLAGNSKSYPMRIDVKRQKCKSFRLEIMDGPALYNYFTDAAQFSGLTLEIGTKKGTVKLPISNITG